MDVHGAIAVSFGDLRVADYINPGVGRALAFNIVVGVYKLRESPVNLAGELQPILISAVAGAETQTLPQSSAKADVIATDRNRYHLRLILFDEIELVNVALLEAGKDGGKFTFRNLILFGIRERLTLIRASLINHVISCGARAGHRMI